MELHKRYPATFIVADQENDIVGYIMCRMETGFSNFGLLGIGKKGHVVSVAVLPEYQQKGIGSALTQKAIKNMRVYKAKECYLEVRVTNTRAITMYKKLGLQIVRTSSGYYADGESAYVMAKKLAK
jgi:ribosomal-protein-alanine N-acetyltransferase